MMGGANTAPRVEIKLTCHPARGFSKSTPKIELETPTHFCSPFLRLIKKLFDFFAVEFEAPKQSKPEI